MSFWEKRKSTNGSDASSYQTSPVNGEISFAEVMNQQYACYLMEKEFGNGGGGVMVEKAEEKNEKKKQEETQEEATKGKQEEIDIPIQLYEDEADTNNDLILARLLQEEFDEEFELHLQRQEEKFNGASKVSISFDSSRKLPASNSDSDSEDDATKEVDDKNRDWDYFEKAEKGSSAITLGRKGFAKNDDGSFTTKHDPTVCGRRNACRVMSFDVGVHTGDGGGFDMKLNNNVYNALKVHSKKESKRAARIHQAKEKSTVEHVMDEKTRSILYKLVNRGILDEINGTVSTGKESHVYHGLGGDPEKQITCGEVAIKVYKTTLNEFKNREAYIKDDHRFKDKFSRQNPRKTIHLWAEKEMHNLMRIRRAGIPCPEVVMLKEHILVMKFIGSDGKHAPSLKHAILSLSQLVQAYADTVEIMKKMYSKCELIHGDLSEYNLLWYLNKVWVIDVSQSVLTNHPYALHFLSRDCHNITKFFHKCGLQDIKTSGELFHEISGRELEGDRLDNIDRLANILDFERDEELLTYGINSKEDNFDELFEKSVIDRANANTNGKSTSKQTLSATPSSSRKKRTSQ